MSAISLFLWIFQIITSYIFKKRNKKIKSKTNYKKSISVIIPCFNEQEETVTNTINSILKSSIKDVEIIIIDDGSNEKLELTEFKNNDNIQIIHFSKNRGKRSALKKGIEVAKNQFIALIDSDTIINPDSMQNALNSLFVNNADAVCGNIKLKNEKDNFLTFLTASMYYVSFCLERGSQSFFKQVTCCSGGFSLYRTKELKKIAPQLIYQTVLGRRVHAGDDRHLTSLLLLKGKKIIWEESAIAYTLSPNTYPEFCKQQKRWARSLTLEIFWLLNKIPKMKPFFIYDISKKPFKILYLIATFILLIQLSITYQSLALFLYPFIFSIIYIKALIIYFWSNKKSMALSLILFGILSYFLLTPLLLYASVTPFKTKWGTRNS